MAGAVPTGWTRRAERALDDACSTLSRRAEEPMAGTAPYAPGWLVVEQPGPWGRNALTESHLDRAVADALAEQAETLPVRVLLARRVGRHADVPGARRVWAAFTEPGRTWLRGTVVEEAAALLAYPLSALAAGEPPPSWEPVDPPMLFVCTNSRRDRCCALRGRTLAASLAARHPGQVWECSHLGGHRFAPTGLVLPYGLTYGRLDEPLAEQVLADAAAGQVTLDRYRGRTCYEAAAQAAEAHLRQMTNWADTDGMRVVATAPDGDVHRVTLATTDGDGWTVTVESRPGPYDRPESCGREPVPVTSWVPTDLTQARRAR